MVDDGAPVRTADIGVLVARARAQLGRSPYRALQYVSCEYDDGAVVISGRLPSYYLRQLALTIVLGHVHGCMPVVDRVEVGNGAALPLERSKTPRHLARGEEDVAPRF
jgi:hypothetical protein